MFLGVELGILVATTYRSFLLPDGYFPVNIPSPWKEKTGWGMNVDWKPSG